MIYYIERDNDIVLYNDNRRALLDSLEFYPQYQGLEINETDEEIITYNGKYYIKSDINEQLINERKTKFNKEFFNTSLGWIRRSVTMANGSTKDFISDLLPVISMAVSSGNPVTILTYDKPDFTQDEIIWELYQHKKNVTPEFIQECFLQLSKDFLPEMI